VSEIRLPREFSLSLLLGLLVAKVSNKKFKTAALLANKLKTAIGIA
jgi:hypothetical protein